MGQTSEQAILVDAVDTDLIRRQHARQAIEYDRMVSLADRGQDATLVYRHASHTMALPMTFGFDHSRLDRSCPRRYVTHHPWMARPR